MTSDGGKGDGRRPMSISDQQYAQRWDLIFGRDLKNEHLLAGNKDSQEHEQRIHGLEKGGGECDGK
jgi:hypothetical protein